MPDILTIKDLEVRYGTIAAVTRLDLTVEEGALVSLLGANGAGKSTTLNTVAGLLKPSHGRIEFAGRDITGAEAYRAVRHGLALVPEGRHVVAPLTVLENLKLSAFARGRRRQASLDEVWELFPRLAERQDQLAGLLSGGEQQMLAIGRAWMTRPTLILLDEPSMGLSPALAEVVFRAIRQMHEAGVTILLVEQNAAVALPISDVAYLIDRGTIVGSGTPRQLEAEGDLVARHLGLDPEVAAPEIERAIDAAVEG